MTLVKFKNNNRPMEENNFFPATLNDLFFSDFFGKDALRTSPAVNIVENKNDFQIELAAPGMTKEDFKIEMENGLLSISAERKDEKRDENSRFTRREFTYSSFKRSFTLPENTDTEKVNAVYENGILKLLIPKREAVRNVKEIKVS